VDEDDEDEDEYDEVAVDEEDADSDELDALDESSDDSDSNDVVELVSNELFISFGHVFCFDFFFNSPSCGFDF